MNFKVLTIFIYFQFRIDLQIYLFVFWGNKPICYVWNKLFAERILREGRGPPFHQRFQCFYASSWMFLYLLLVTVRHYAGFLSLRFSPQLYRDYLPVDYDFLCCRNIYLLSYHFMKYVVRRYYKVFYG